MAAEAYIIAITRGREQDAPPDWAAALAAIEGVTVSGVTARRARFIADADALARVRQRFGDEFQIEQEAGRNVS
jgi:hypothetical protein